MVIVYVLEANTPFKLNPFRHIFRFLVKVIVLFVNVKLSFKYIYCPKFPDVPFRYAFTWLSGIPIGNISHSIGVV